MSDHGRYHPETGTRGVYVPDDEYPCVLAAHVPRLERFPGAEAWAAEYWQGRGLDICDRAARQAQLRRHLKGGSTVQGMCDLVLVRCLNSG